MAHLTGVKLIGEINEAVAVMAEVGEYILGPELIDEIEMRQSAGRRGKRNER